MFPSGTPGGPNPQVHGSTEEVREGEKGGSGEGTVHWGGRYVGGPHDFRGTGEGRTDVTDPVVPPTATRTTRTVPDPHGTQPPLPPGSEASQRWDQDRGSPPLPETRTPHLHPTLEPSDSDPSIPIETPHRPDV